MKSLGMRANKVTIPADFVDPDSTPRALSDLAEKVARETADRIRRARQQGSPVMLTFGAHSIKNGLGLLLSRLIEEGWVTHLATNGAGIIHDWEIAFQGQTSEDVKGGIERGEFGNWQETGLYINLAIAVGAWEGLGYGASVGSLIENEGLNIPEESELIQAINDSGTNEPDRCAAAFDLLHVKRQTGILSGWMPIAHPFKRFSLQGSAYRLNIPFTGHPMIGHDIIYNHPANCGGAIGRTAERDFLTFADSVSRISDGVYLSVGSAVMSPMVFEKSISMAQNLAIQAGKRISGHFITVVDLAESRWDWSQGEPPEDTPDYYIRYCKSFSRMGGELRYSSADNRDFLLALYARLK